MNETNTTTTIASVASSILSSLAQSTTTMTPTPVTSEIFGNSSSVDSIIGEIITNSTTTTTEMSISSSGSGGFIKYRSDGLREPPNFVAANNLIIMIVGLSLLIVPVVGFLVCMVAKSRTLRNLRSMKLTSGFIGDGDEEGMPYSHFESDEQDEYVAPSNLKTNKSQCHQVPKDARVLINSDNTVVGSPNRTAKDVIIVKSKSSMERAPLNDECATLDVDATFIVPGSSSRQSHT